MIVYEPAFITLSNSDVTAIRVPPYFVYSHTHIASKYVTVDLDVSLLFCYGKLYYLRLFSLTGTVSTLPNLGKGRVMIVALRAPSSAKFGEVDTVPVSENSLKYNTFF